MLTYVKQGKFSAWMFYDDQTYQVVVEKSGALFVNWVSGVDPLNTTKWVQLQDPTPQNCSNYLTAATIVKNLTDVLADVSNIWMARDKKIFTFPSRTFTETSISNTTIARGDAWFLLAGKFLYSVIMNVNGTFNPVFMKVIDTEVDPEKVTRVMVADSNIIIFFEKKIKIYQYQNQKFELKQSFDPFKDVEDIAISRVSATRLYKLKASKNKFKLLSTLPSAEWNPYTEGIGRTPQLGDTEYSEIEFLEAGYCNLVIRANTGKQFKYFIASGTATAFKFIEIFNSTKGNYTGAIETNSHVFLFKNETDLVVIHKSSTYKSMKGSIPDGTKISTIISKSYVSEFSGVSDFSKSSNVMAAVTSSTEGEYRILPLGLGRIQIVCNPLTSLLGFFKPEDQAAIDFTILGFNSENSYLPEVRFNFNAYFIYNYGPTGSFFWLWVWIVVNITILLLIYRLVRLAYKRSRMAVTINKLNLDRGSLKASSETDGDEVILQISDGEDEPPTLKQRSSGI
jgi:hypothetical protein